MSLGMKNGKKLYYQQGRANRKLQAQAFVFPPRVAATVTLSVFLLLGYFWLQNTTEAVGRKTKTLEQELQLVEEDIRTQQAGWHELTSPQGLENALRDFNIPMVHAHGPQAVTVRNRGVWLDRRPSRPANDMEARLQ